MTADKKHYQRRARPRSGKKGNAGDRDYASLHVRRTQTGAQHRQVQYEKPRIDPGLESVFRRIGVPEPEPFRPDSFQQEALDLIKDYDVLVSAPTGSGKTWIASQAIRAYLSEDLRVWYASPLKALSNSIYQQLCHEFGPQNCGILTGDRKENPEAPVIVGTTEILRNQLYDAMHRGASIRADLVILDEAHYLSDPDRGVVWEEVLVYLAPRVRLLLLSATISNADEVCAWLSEIRGAPNRVVRSEERPVSLETLFLFPDGLVVSLGGKKGLNARIKKFLASQSGRRERRRKKIHFGDVIRCLRDLDLLPAIFFLKSRRDCDEAILTCPHVDKSPEARKSLEDGIRAFLEDYPHLKGHRQMRSLMKSRVVSHHGGQLPYWKVLVEKMMNMGYLEAIFSTSTVAAGVNFPARAVVLVQSDRYNGHEFADLTATELHQMIGRAGRRGKDHVGFAVILPGRHQDPGLIHELTDSPPEPILSQIRINFSMTLNLLLSQTPLEVRDLLGQSFAAFRERESEASIKIHWDQLVGDLMNILAKGKCDTSDPYEVIYNISIRSELQDEVKRLTQTKAARHKRLVGFDHVTGVEALNRVRESIRSLPCEGCKHLRTCHSGKKGRLGNLLKNFSSLSSHIEAMSDGLWFSFKRHVRFLKETGFVDEVDRLTPDGYWASKLRLDQPLLIAEAIRRGGLQGLSPETMVGCLAVFVWDKVQETEIRVRGNFDLKDLEIMFNRMLDYIQPLMVLKSKRGFENPSIVFWPAAALFMWCKGVPWDRLLNLVRVSDGDMASLIMRTADHLRQIANLRETHPDLALVAEDAIERILREPVYV